MRAAGGGGSPLLPAEARHPAADPLWAHQHEAHVANPTADKGLHPTDLSQGESTPWLTDREGPFERVPALLRRHATAFVCQVD